MVNYANGKIYKLLNTIDDEVYIGSTTQPLHKRLSWHKQDANGMCKTARVYTHMRELGVDKFYIELIEEFPCTNNSMLTAREGTFIRELGTLNTVVAGRTRQEYQIENKQRLNEISAKYHREHKEELNKKNRAYASVKIVCDCGSEMRRDSLSGHKKSQKHKDLMEQLEKLLEEEIKNEDEIKVEEK